MKICAVDGCSTKSRIYGFCKKHAHRFERYGDPLAGATFQGVPQEFFDATLRSQTDECVIWPFATLPSGYGTLHVEGRTTGVHRTMCFSAHGPPPSAKSHAAHACGNRLCMNPRHLRWATAVENNSDKIKHGTHQIGSRSGTAKLVEADVLEIHRLGEIGQSSQQIAKRFGINKHHVNRILRGDSWGHIYHGNQRGIMRLLSAGSVRGMAAG